MAVDYRTRLPRSLLELDTPVSPPGIELGSKRVDRAQFVVKVPMHRQAFGLLPPPDGGDMPVEMRRNLLPRVEAIAG
jgi:hypothetical protein